VTASYFILFATWIVGALIRLALGAQLRLQRERLVVILGSVIWAVALMGLNAVAPKPIKLPVAQRAAATTAVIPSAQPKAPGTGVNMVVVLVVGLTFVLVLLFAGSRFRVGPEAVGHA
jgi:hypothetical protein